MSYHSDRLTAYYCSDISIIALPWAYLHTYYRDLTPTTDINLNQQSKATMHCGFTFLDHLTSRATESHNLKRDSAKKATIDQKPQFGHNEMRHVNRLEARILYHSNSYTYIVFLFAVKYSLWRCGWIQPTFFLRKMLGTRYGSVGTRFLWF